MSERSNANPSPGRVLSERAIPRDVSAIDCSGLWRVVELSNSGRLTGEALAALLRHEASLVETGATEVNEQLQQALVELRQLRESAEREQVQRQDEQRQLQDDNDRFVANLIHDHEVELGTLRRERDAAIDRIRELSRGLARTSTASSPSLPRISGINHVPSEIPELKARIEELLRERERSLKLLRQLAEQRDHAENRLQLVLRSAESQADAAIDTERSRSRSAANAATMPPSPESDGHDVSITSAISGVRAPFDPQHAAPSPNPALGNLEDPDAWETQPPGAAPDETRERPRTSGNVDRPGAYSVTAEALAVEQVFPRGTRRAPTR